MKKILSLLIVLALALSLVACRLPGNDDDNPGGNPGQEPTNPTIPSDGENNIETPNYPVGGDNAWH